MHSSDTLQKLLNLRKYTQKQLIINKKRISSEKSTGRPILKAFLA